MDCPLAGPSNRRLLRKKFWADHFDEISAIMRGVNHRRIDSPVRGWRKDQEEDGA